MLPLCYRQPVYVAGGHVHCYDDSPDPFMTSCGKNAEILILSDLVFALGATTLFESWPV